jgi:hypothetical protein
VLDRVLLTKGCCRCMCHQVLLAALLPPVSLRPHAAACSGDLNSSLNGRGLNSLNDYKRVPVDPEAVLRLDPLPTKSSSFPPNVASFTIFISLSQLRAGNCCNRCADKVDRLLAFAGKHFSSTAPPGRGLKAFIPDALNGTQEAG